MADIPKANPLTEPRKPWPLTAPHRSRINLLPRTARAGNIAAASASETTAVAKKSQLSSARESSFSFSHRARAFKTYFIRRLDDYPFLTSLSNRTLGDSIHSHPTTTLNQSSLPTSDQSPSYTYNTFGEIPEPGHFASIRELCQQACSFAIHLGKRATFHGSEYAKSLFVGEPWDTIPTTLIQPPLDSNSSTTSLEHSAHKVGAQDSSDVTAGRHSQELRGSCMAVVIGLVVGIMWF